MKFKRDRNRRDALRDLRQGGTGETPWRWRKLSIPGRCAAWRNHFGSESKGRELYRGTRFAGVRGASGMPTNGQIYNSGSLCGDCAIAFEGACISKLSARRSGDTIEMSSGEAISAFRRTGKSQALFENTFGIPMYPKTERFESTWMDDDG